MVELGIFCLFGLALIGAHFIAAVIYKAKTHSKKSVWWIMGNEI